MKSLTIILAIIIGLGIMQFTNNLPTSQYSVEVEEIPQISWQDFFVFMGYTEKDIEYMGAEGLK